MPRLVLAMALVLAALPAAALGCPSCYGSGSERVIEAYQASTLFLSLLPFGIVGTIGAAAWWFARAGGAAVAPKPPLGDRPPVAGRRRGRLRLVRSTPAGGS